VQIQASLARQGQQAKELAEGHSRKRAQSWVS
jgi:hypothetical protein